MDGVEQDHAKLTNELGALELKMTPIIADLEAKRELAISQAKTNLATYGENTKFLRAELEKRRGEQISTAERELKQYEQLLPAQAAYWETRNNADNTKTIWILADALKATATAGTKLETQKDGSIFATGENKQSDYRIAVHTTLTNITGVMLEVLPDERLPGIQGGRAADGNFVLSEIELRWAADTNTPDTLVKFTQARADFSQQGYPVAAAIDGTAEPGQNGWAIAGAPGIQRHTATFALEHPIGATNGTSLQFKLIQRYADSFNLGRFRLSITTAADPLDFGLPQNVVQSMASPPGQRQPEQTAAIIDYYRFCDPEFWKRKQSLLAAKEPLPDDPRLAELQRALSTVEEPIQLDPYLVQLRQDTLASAKQCENKRLTVVQDLTWALINSSAFLFNH